MKNKNLHILPVSVMFTSTLNFSLTWVFALANGHVEVGSHYIGDFGALPPESCFYSFMLIITALLSAICVYIQYGHVDDITKAMEHAPAQRLNKYSLWFGAASCLGVCVVICFQKNNAYYVHLLGVHVTYLGGNTYILCQTLIHYWLGENHFMGHPMFRIRLVLCVLCTVFFPFAIIANIQTKDKPDDSWEIQVFCNVSEWIASGGFIAFITTFAWYFKHVDLQSPAVTFQRPNSASMEKHIISNDFLDQTPKTARGFDLINALSL